MKRYYSVLFVVFIIGCSKQNDVDAAKFFLKANYAFEQKKYDEAIRLFGETIEKKQDFADAYNNRGVAYLKMEDTKKALTDFDKAIAIDKRFWTAYFNRAGVLIELRKLTEAQNDLEKIRTTYQDSSDYYLKWGDLKMAENNIQVAIGEYEHAILLSNNNVQALVNRGTAYFQIKSFQKAQTDFEKALQFDGRQAQSFNNLGLIYAEQKQLGKAEIYIDKALNIDPANAIFINNKGYVLLLKGQIEEAKILIDSALEKNGNNAYAHRNLGVYYLKTNNKELAIIEMKKAHELDPTIEIDLEGQ